MTLSGDIDRAAGEQSRAQVEQRTCGTRPKAKPWAAMLESGESDALISVDVPQALDT